jgi:hypothetical protein
MDGLRAILSLKEKVEYKVPIPPFRGSEAPAMLQPPHPGYLLRETKESQILTTVMSRMFSNKWYQFRISTILNISSSGTGAINSTIAMSLVQSNPDFVALSGVFNEFFIKSATVKYEPNSMYNYPLTGVVATSVSSLPVGCADLQHAQPAYTSITSATENWRYEHNNSGRPFVYGWQNSESPNSTVTPDTSGVNTQSWCMVSNAANYTGNLQFISQPAPPALPVSQVLGVFLVEWDLLFRVRL